MIVIPSEARNLPTEARNTHEVSCAVKIFLEVLRPAQDERWERAEALSVAAALHPVYECLR